MNRLIIVGNGFDLAHGLASRYEDFILYLINKSVEDVNNQYDSSIMFEKLFKLKKNYKNVVPFEPFESIDQIKADRRIFKTPNYKFLSNRYQNTENWTTAHILSITFNSKLFHDLFSKKNWTDVEKAYFDLLSSIYKKHIDQTTDSPDLIKLNQEFELIKALFIEYITELNQTQIHKDPKLLSEFAKCFEFDIYKPSNPTEQSSKFTRRFNIERLIKIVIVNFNYTGILQNYLPKSHFQKTIISIHGETSKPNSIVFGYGDEMTEYYKKLEDLDSEEVLKHFKSHYYHSNDSYAKLLYEVEFSEFDVVVFGHSLGLSDRLLLNTIFENPNCKAIHLFHSGGDSHFKRRIALSRHFDDKKEFRKKLVEESDYLKIQRNK